LHLGTWSPSAIHEKGANSVECAQDSTLVAGPSPPPFEVEVDAHQLFALRLLALV
jgi:hypothetical protein